MTERRNLAIRIFEGVPRFAGEVFRETKAPIIVFLVLLFGNPIVSTVVVIIASRIYHWRFPLRILIMSLVFPATPEQQAHFSPQLKHIIQAMSPAELTLAQDIGSVRIITACIGALVFFWWLFMFARLLRRRRNRV
jgi:hypothetical protein